ncbi:hypothetical protein A2572_03910 [Candidatus Collierbacteria bacterium RIFOXYD1_FULL_40_9]|uniref:Uncharacterized protein n=1 Tax=Candidatus Collierbacteria bacterium RIFOXYD1_FULL_40_9 TaxID=1817731 RepID=A0A1F5FW28_9BACT|nr:MAG: hypothetical protein A2572_03910 [Candidatus Collierbacteria bacterium RIFOXYD1_FULL_40_9]
MDNNNNASNGIALDPNQMAPQDSSPLVQTGSTEPKVLDITPRDSTTPDPLSSPIQPSTPSLPTPDPLSTPLTPVNSATPVAPTTPVTAAAPESTPVSTPPIAQNPLAEDPNAVNTIG